MKNYGKVDFSKMLLNEKIELFKSIYTETIPTFLMSTNAKYIQTIINQSIVIHNRGRIITTILPNYE